LFNKRPAVLRNVLTSSYRPTADDFAQLSIRVISRMTLVAAIMLLVRLIASEWRLFDSEKRQRLQTGLFSSTSTFAAHWAQYVRCS